MLGSSPSTTWKGSLPSQGHAQTRQNENCCPGAGKFDNRPPGPLYARASIAGNVDGPNPWSAPVADLRVGGLPVQKTEPEKGQRANDQARRE